MSRTKILIAISFLFLSIYAKSQTIQTSETISNVENATYLKGDLTELLLSEIRYPLEALQNNIQGDVILSFIIDKNGNTGNLEILSSPDILLSASSIVSFDNLEKAWSPCKINGIPINKKYKLVFRYRMYLNAKPPEYKKTADALFKKQKNEKALSTINKAIKENPFDFELFESRSKLKELLGDAEGAEQDYIASLNIKNEIIWQFQILVIGKTRVEKTVVF